MLPIDPIPPVSVKQNQHYVPRFWLARFASADGRVFGFSNGQARQVGVGNIMSEDWTYTIFDGWWRPDDALENALSVAEGTAGIVFNQIHALSAAPTKDEWEFLGWFLALTACRHPDVMSRGHNRSKELAWVLADVKSSPDRQTFNAELRRRFGFELPEELFEALAAKSVEDLLNEGDEVEKLSPQDPRLPQQIAIEAAGQVAVVIAGMNLALLDAPSGQNFVLGDRAVPHKSLAAGFDVPLSAQLAFQAVPAGSGAAPFERRRATVAEVEAINGRQFARHQDMMIGSDPATLRAVAGLP